MGVAPKLGGVVKRAHNGPGISCGKVGNYAVGRRNRVLFPSHTLRMPSSSLTHSSDSTGLGWNFDRKVRMG